MKIKAGSVLLLGLTFSVAGCSSVSLPSLPSLPWSSSAAIADPTAEALFEEGGRYFKEKRYARSIDALTKLKTEHPFSPQVTEAELKIADAYYLNQQYPEAINTFKEFQSMHPTNENIPFVIYRLGQAHFDQFTSADRDQKNTEIAKTYFESVVAQYPKSPYAIEAREKLAKCLEYLAEHDFNVASFYLKQEKYPAARERFEEIVRKYRGTPAAAKSLFFLRESYRNEQNNVKAGLAYEALIQHYPQSKFAAEAKTQLAQLEKNRQDPLAMLLMRDRRPGAAVAPAATQETASNAKLKDIDNLVAKSDIAWEEPGEEKGLFRRVVDTINPFSSSDDGNKKGNSKPQNATQLAVKKKASEKEEPPGTLATLWNGINPFGAKNSKDNRNDEAANGGGLVDQIDESLKQKGFDAKSQTAALKPPAAAMPEAEEPPAQTADPGKLLGDIDANLKKSGKQTAELPPPPEAAEVFRDAAAAQAAVAKAQAKPEPQQNATNPGLLSSIDQKLKNQGIEPSKFEAPPAAAEPNQASKPEEPKQVELEPKASVEKGPLFLSPTDLPARSGENLEQETTPAQKEQAPEEREFPRALVKGPAQSQSASPAGKTPEQKKSVPGEEEPKGVFQQLRDDIDNASKILNPFRW
jgi:outer membrane protein assembly factor BamD